MHSPDDFYAALLDAHRDLSDAQSQELHAKLVLLLADALGDDARVAELLAAARASVLARASRQGDGAV